MKRNLLTILFISVSLFTYSQNYYKHKEDRIITVVSINESKNYTGTNFCNVNLFTDEVNYRSDYSIIGYTFLGIDNDFNIHIEMKVNIPIIDKKETRNLVFRSEKGHAKITLPNDSSRINIEPIELEVTASNNGMEVKYIGNFKPYDIKTAKF